MKMRMKMNTGLLCIRMRMRIYNFNVCKITSNMLIHKISKIASNGKNLLVLISSPEFAKASEIYLGCGDCHDDS
jgi:hypothetical protein